MQTIYPQIQALGGQVVAISFTPPARVAAFLQRYPHPFPVVSDPTMAGYRWFVLGRTSLLSLLRLNVLVRYMKLILRGWWPGKPGKGEDILQLGGDFVLDGQGRMVYSHPMQEATDRPSATELLQALSRATES